MTSLQLTASPLADERFFWRDRDGHRPHGAPAVSLLAQGRVLRWRKTSPAESHGGQVSRGQLNLLPLIGPEQGG